MISMLRFVGDAPKPDHARKCVAARLVNDGEEDVSWVAAKERTWEGEIHQYGVHNDPRR